MYLTTVEMGVFGYECACGGKTCNNVGTQEFADHVIIEVPLKDGSTVYLQGVYEGYGSVFVGDVEFFLEQFNDYFDSWLDDRPIGDREVYLARRIWTQEEDYWPVNDDRDLVIKPGRMYRTCFDNTRNTLTTYATIYRDKMVLVDGGITQSEVKRLKHELRMKELADRKKELEELEARITRLTEACP